MADPRLDRLAEVLVGYSLDLQPGMQLAVYWTPLAAPLVERVQREALRRGAQVFSWGVPDSALASHYRYASEAQLDYVSPLYRSIVEQFDALLTIDAEVNTHLLSAVDPARVARRARAHQTLYAARVRREASGELRSCSTLYPTPAAAQDAEMSLADYEDFVFAAGKLDQPDPVSAWRAEGRRQQKWIDWLRGRERVEFHGPDIDLKFSIAGRAFAPACGRQNFPDGEIYTAPVEDSVDGWVRFRYPGSFHGQAVSEVELWFERGAVVRQRAGKGEAQLLTLLETDPGARRIGEWGIGTNYDIQQFSRNMLFDEKMGGTIHFALGFGFPECGSRNESALHWDLLVDMTQGEIVVDGERFYDQGSPQLGS
jgi:aminopeptidase